MSSVTHSDHSASHGHDHPRFLELRGMIEDGRIDTLVVAITDMQGRRVQSESRAMPAGPHRLRWDGMTFGRQRAATGIYFVRTRVAGTEFVRRVVRF